jgi:hypothetical protein
MQPLIHCLGISLTDNPPELLRSYLEFGPLFLPLTFGFHPSPTLRVGEYIFDFAVVIFGVRLCMQFSLPQTNLTPSVPPPSSDSGDSFSLDNTGLDLSLSCSRM